MSENRGLIAVVVVLLIALAGIVCVGLGAVIYCSQPTANCPVIGRTAVGPASTPVSPVGVPTLAPRPAQSNVLRVPGGNGGGGDPPTLDPALAGDAESAVYVAEIYSGLVALDPDLKVKPDIAEKWDVSADGTVFTFYLRKDAKFQDGRPVTAQDFKYSIERAADPRTASTTAETYLGDIVGVKDKLNGVAKEVKGVKVVDDYTLEITIDAPKAYFLAKMTFPTAYVVDKNNVERGGRTWTDNPNGTGPYRLKEYARSQRIVLVKNDLYYGDPKPKIDEVQYILGGGSFMTMYENGDLDATAVSLADIERVSDTSNPLNKELYVGPYLSTGFVVFNVRKSPFDDANVRQAFAMAINRRQLVDVVFKKMPLVAQGILPPAMPGYTADVQGVAYDPDKAKQLLAASKYAGKLPEITWYTVGAGGAAAQDVQAMTQMLKTNLGVEVSIQQTDWATFIGQLNGRDNPYQMFDIGWVADYADPQNFVEVLFRTGSLQNWSGYSNPDLDKLLDQAGVSKDSAERFKLYQQAQQMILKDVPVLPLTYSREYWLTKSYVKADPANALYPPMIIPRLKYLSIVK